MAHDLDPEEYDRQRYVDDYRSNAFFGNRSESERDAGSCLEGKDESSVPDRGASNPRSGV